MEKKSQHSKMEGCEKRTAAEERNQVGMGCSALELEKVQTKDYSIVKAKNCNLAQDVS